MHQDILRDVKETDKGEVEAPILALLVYLGVGILFAILAYSLTLAAFQSGTDTNVVNQTGSEVKVTAIVPLELSYKEILSSDRKAIVVSGNYKKGFMLLDPVSGKVVFEYNSVPKEGVIVIVPETYNNVVFLPKY